MILRKMDWIQDNVSFLAVMVGSFLMIGDLGFAHNVYVEVLAFILVMGGLMYSLWNSMRVSREAKDAGGEGDDVLTLAILQLYFHRYAMMLFAVAMSVYLGVKLAFWSLAWYDMWMSVFVGFIWFVFASLLVSFRRP